MVPAKRVSVLVPVLLSALCLPAAVHAQAAPASPARPALADELAKTYGLDGWSQVDAVRYTFVIDLPGLKLSRSWIWEPKTTQVTYDGPGKDGKPVHVTYKRSEIASQSADVKGDIDPAFVNDQYWLVFPFHVIWDVGPTVTDAGMQKLNLGKGKARQLVVQYPSGGYTPGDTWKLFVGKDGRVSELDFKHGGDAKPAVVRATWTNYVKAGPLLVSLDHRGTADGKPFSLFFRKVAVKLSGSDAWVEAK